MVGRYLGCTSNADVNHPSHQNRTSLPSQGFDLHKHPNYWLKTLLQMWEKEFDFTSSGLW
jgi:hypothetical protein